MLASRPTEASLHLVLLALLVGTPGGTSLGVVAPLAVLAGLAIAADHLHWRWLKAIAPSLRHTSAPGICHGLLALPMLLQAALTTQQAQTGGQQPTELLLRACTFSSFAILLSLCLLELFAPVTTQRQPPARTNGHSTPAPSPSKPNGTPDQPSRRLPIHPAYLIAAATLPCLLLLCRPSSHPHAPPLNSRSPHPHPPSTAGRPALGHPSVNSLPALLSFAALHLALLATLIHQLPGSFTLCEATLVSQATATTAALLLRALTHHAPTLHHLLLHHWGPPRHPHPPPDAPTHPDPHPALIPAFVILLCSLVLLASASVAVLALHPPTPPSQHRKQHQPATSSPPTSHRRPATPRLRALLATLAALTLAACTLAMASLAAWVLRWLAAGPVARRWLLQYWVAVLAGGLPVMLALLRGGRCPHIIVRKGYHLLAVALFLPAAVLDLPMLAVSLAIAFALLAALEALRAAKAGPLGRAIDGFMAGFTDARDAGPLYLTHFTLLLGMAVPVWLAAGIWPPPPHGTAASAPAVVVALSGVVCLGLGDTAASAVGFLLGRHRMFLGSSKTWEGTAAGFGASLAGWLALQAAGALHVPQGGWLGLVACSAAASLLEAATTQLDNLFVPVFYATGLLAAMHGWP